jgi:GTPase
MTLEELKKTWMNRLPATKCVFISATDKENVEELKEIMYSEIKRIFAIRYPFNNFLY